MIKLGKIAACVAVTWVIYLVVTYLDPPEVFGIPLEFFPAFYAVALLAASLAALWDRETPVFFSFAVGALSVFQWGYIMSLWQTAKSFLIYGGGSAVSSYMLIPLAFALITGTIAATGGFLVSLAFHLLRGRKLVAGRGSRYRESIGLRVGFIAGSWVLISALWLYYQGFYISAATRGGVAFTVYLFTGLVFFLGALLARAGRRIEGGILLMAWGGFLAGVSFLAILVMPYSTVIGTMPGLLAIGAGVALYSGTQVQESVRVGARS